ncbi:hypothetical protein KSP40_PGU007927 [Platanthera guangdongensis]|uniref:3-beta hydroxysteroid dehydrogenase/isomerase domain-containing protein n=1 Tax=Platanthera guangdongensis TaxID=2320717 RepID=A0ABR2MG40_9ASPA
MHLSENEGIEGNRFVVTGGLGFVGSALCLELVRRGAEEVRTLDTRISSPWSPDLQKSGVRCIRGDVSQKEDLKEALRGVNCVFHLASYGMSGKEMLQSSRIDEVNLIGTCNVLDVCHEIGIKRLVYVSTYNVVFGGKEIVNGNEFLPYYPIDEHVDPYGRSKSIAEQLVLKSNGRPAKKKSGVSLYTCAIRPAAIYGPGEQRHFPRILSLAQMGLAFFKVGDDSVKTDWVYMDNLVLALILASMGLLDDIPGRKGLPVAAGQAYFISDGTDHTQFVSLPFLFRSLNFSQPKFLLRFSRTLFLGRIKWLFFVLRKPFLRSSKLDQIFPLLLVFLRGSSHILSLTMIKCEGCYRPILLPHEGSRRTSYFLKTFWRRCIESSPLWSLILCSILIIWVCTSRCLPYLKNIKPIGIISIVVIRKDLIIHLKFAVSVLNRISNGTFAHNLIKAIVPHKMMAQFNVRLFKQNYPSLQWGPAPSGSARPPHLHVT